MITSRRIFSVISTAAILLLSRGASASSMYINFIPKEWFEALIHGIGYLGMLFSIGLGVVAVRLAVKEKLDSSLKVFGRGFLGVSAIIGFGVSLLLLFIGREPGGRLADALVGVVLVVLAAEFCLAGFLYRRVFLKKRSAGAAVLSALSFVISVIVALIALYFFIGNYQGKWPLAAVFFAGGMALAAAGARSIQKSGFPETAGRVFRHGFWYLGAFFVFLLGTGIMGKKDATGAGQAVKDDSWMYVCFSLLAVLCFFMGWLYRRAALIEKKLPAKVLAIAHFAAGVLIALILLFAVLGS